MSEAPEMWKWRSASNTDYIGYDEANHSWSPEPVNVSNLGVGFGLYFMMVHFYAPEWLSILILLILQFIWQVKNALIPYVTQYVKDHETTYYFRTTTTWEKRYFGGFGYSYRQQIYGAGGVFIAFLLDVMWPPAIQPSREEENEEMEEVEEMDEMDFEAEDAMAF